MGVTSFMQSLDTHVLSSTDAEQAEANYGEYESPPGQASYSLQSYQELFSGYPWPSTTPGQPGFEEDAPPELREAMKNDDGESSVLCGASMGDQRISCGVHLFDDPKSGAPYVVLLKDPGRALKAVMPQVAGGAEDMAAGAPIQSLGPLLLAPGHLVRGRPGLVVRNTFLEFSGKDPLADYEENLPTGRTRAFSDITDNKLPWKVPISSGADSGLFQIARKRFASDQEELYMRDLELPSVLETPATISQEAGSRVPPPFPTLLGNLHSPCSGLMHGYGLPEMATWPLNPAWNANMPAWGDMSMFPPTPSLAAALWKEQGLWRHLSVLKKESNEARKKKMDGKKGKEGNSLPVGVQVKADKVPQPEPTSDPTTVMLRHIPNRYTSAQLVDLLDAKGFKAKYDFVYLPIDFQNKVNLGYCFVNLLSNEWALRFKQEFEGFRDWLFDSIKASEVSWAHPHQGLQEHIERYRNSPVMHPSMPMEYKPLIFSNGIQIPFPTPTRTIKAPKVRTNRDRQGSKEV